MPSVEPSVERLLRVALITVRKSVRMFRKYQTLFLVILDFTNGIKGIKYFLFSTKIKSRPRLFFNVPPGNYYFFRDNTKI